MKIKPIRLRLVKYRLDMRKPEDKAKYKEIKKAAKALGYQLMDCFSGSKHDWMDKLPELHTIETKHLFHDQYNSVEGFRIHDWYENIHPNNRFLEEGYYLVGETDDDLERLAMAKRDQLTCGYCGDRSGVAGQGFCTKCLDSPYLEEKDLHLLRLRSIADDDIRSNRPSLTDDERGALLPLYVQRQTTGATSRNAAKLAKQRADLHSDFDESSREALTKRDGMLWLMDNGLSIDNVIYYSHTDKFGFGWRKPIGAAVLSNILDKISEFPFSYEIKCEDGRTLSN